jgi:hypothetical protein
MLPSDVANRARWRGEAGFFEIWFLVVFAPGARRAWWLRYTTFAPAPGRPGSPRATVWAAAFDAAACAPAFAVKAIAPIAAYDAGGPQGFRVRIGDAELANGACRGAVAAGGHAIAWDLRFAPAEREARRTPWLLHRLPLPTRVSHANSEVACTGRVTVDGVTSRLEAAPAVQKHIWGTRRVEELFWLYCGAFVGDPAARLEATSVRLHRRLGGGPPLPRLTTLWLRTAERELDACRLAALPRNHFALRDGAGVEFRSGSVTRAVHAVAWCDPRTLAGWVYRDPRGWDVHVAQSDLASCTLELRTRAHPLAPWRPAHRLECREAAALELHAPEPLPGVRYVPWDATA